MLFLRITLIVCLGGLDAYGQTLDTFNLPKVQWELGPTGTTASLRGLSTAGDRSIWACGSEATVIRSTDGGSSWIECGPRNFASLEFRSLHAWDENSACIASAGSPAVILRTQDGGATWLEVFRHESAKAFFDGLKFWDSERGIVFGDPIDGRLCVLESFDGGMSWYEPPTAQLPGVFMGEAGFAASNSAMVIADGGKVWIGTGGREANTSRVFMRQNWSAAWTASDCPLRSGATQGIFSLAVGNNPQQLLAVGGDYRAGENSATTAAISGDGGISWRIPEQPPASFCSAVVRVDTARHGGEFYIATGPSGSALSLDAEQWLEFSQSGFHVLSVSPNRTVFAAGSDGRFAKLILGQ